MFSPLSRRIAVAVTAAATLVGCSSGGGTDPGAASPAASSGSADTVRYAAPGSPSNAASDPHGLLPGESDLVRMALTYDVLTLPGPGGETLPRLATSWEPDETLTRWKITIRGGVKFSDGRAVKAADALFSLRRMGEKAAENFGRMEMFDLAASKVLDDTAFELVTRKPYAEVGKALEGATFVVPEGSTDFTGPVPGSGPFRPAGGDAQAAKFERNDGWWGPKPPSRYIEVRAIPDPQTRGEALLSGQVDLAAAVPAALVKQHADDPAVKVVRRTGATLYPLVMRTDTKPFDDRRVREAVRLTLDREQLLQVAFLGFGEVGNDLLTPKDPASPTGLPQRTRDVERARKLMAEAGYAGGVDLTLHSTTAYPGMDSAATLIAQQLGEIGIRAKVELAPADTYFSTVWGKEPFYLGYLGGIPFLDVVRVALKPGSPTNETAWEDKAWNADLEKALAEPDEAERRTRLGELQTRLRDEGGYAVWALSDRLDLAGPGLTGLPEGIGFSAGFIDQVALGR
ncbi:ABC transporter substrate-binding protein [Planomonospora sp. ID67723]|uniref:ABC transporter substrate-binding protein n=1 Tax=Planomonospora sp. ID67723 TaxID=2738134 RepID=UPI0018C3E322|nr:ABC transporter substrate-binding protein [Planomonospora sp. ID67723]MBG0832718.1 ABC transporter substrate-binding protein [Planomonospora sp. ID67723]